MTLHVVHLREAEDVFLNACNVTYRYTFNAHATEGRKRQLEVVALKRIRSSSTHAIELLGNYGIGYWIPYILKHHQQWGEENEAVKCVLWLLLSKQSSMEAAERRTYLGKDHLLPQATRDKYANMTCPFPMTNSRKRSRHHD